MSCSATHEKYNGTTVHVAGGVHALTNNTAHRRQVDRRLTLFVFEILVLPSFHVAGSRACHFVCVHVASAGSRCGSRSVTRHMTFSAGSGSITCDVFFFSFSYWFVVGHVRFFRWLWFDSVRFFLFSKRFAVGYMLQVRNLAGTAIS